FFSLLQQVHRDTPVASHRSGHCSRYYLWHHCPELPMSIGCAIKQGKVLSAQMKAVIHQRLLI
ncbi:MAG: hypothetical protein AAF438_21360, partial [Pseudomonadota bacterium]